jgi:hypothetical protein
VIPNNTEIVSNWVKIRVRIQVCMCMRYTRDFWLHTVVVRSCRQCTSAPFSTITYHILFTMEHLFSPCARLYDILESRGRLERFRRRHPEPLQELNLNVSTEELLSAERAFTYADLHAMLENEATIAWLTPNTAVDCQHGRSMRYWNQLNGL